MQGNHRHREALKVAAEHNRLHAGSKLLHIVPHAGEIHAEIERIILRAENCGIDAELMRLSLHLSGIGEDILISGRAVDRNLKNLVFYILIAERIVKAQASVEEAEFGSYLEV